MHKCHLGFQIKNLEGGVYFSPFPSQVFEEIDRNLFHLNVFVEERKISDNRCFFDDNALTKSSYYSGIVSEKYFNTLLCLGSNNTFSHPSCNYCMFLMRV